MTESELIKRARIELETSRDIFLWRPKAFILGGKGKIIIEDIFSCFDLIGIEKGQVLFFQVTTTPNASAREKKIKERFCSSTDYPHVYLLTYNIRDNIWYTKRICLNS